MKQERDKEGQKSLCFLNISKQRVYMKGRSGRLAHCLTARPTGIQGACRGFQGAASPSDSPVATEGGADFDQGVPYLSFPKKFALHCTLHPALPMHSHPLLLLHWRSSPSSVSDLNGASHMAQISDQTCKASQRGKGLQGMRYKRQGIMYSVELLRPSLMLILLTQ